MDSEVPSSDQKAPYLEYLAVVIRHVQPRYGSIEQFSGASRLTQIRWGHYGYITWFIGITTACILILANYYTLSLIVELIFIPIMLICWGMELWVRGWRNAHFGLQLRPQRQPDSTTRTATSSYCPV